MAGSWTSRVDRAKALMEGGQVERFHCFPHHRPYSVAAHSWNMAALLSALYPGASKRLLQAVLFHDVAERWTGDSPYPLKHHLCPPAGKLLEKIEHRILEEGLGIQMDLSPNERDWLKALDMLEFRNLWNGTQT